ncbi:MAG: L,D-transpeptidase family protein [Sphingomonadales bacterium]|nr:L,D-transpeptidase family protein [Sphingomonadales bacterium]MDE2568579.1 L,D-transpeptidase family protein [Sphingomonadales bacterium]
MTPARLLPLLALAGLGGADSAARARDLPDVDFVLVEKAARRLTLFAQGRAVRVYPDVQLGEQPVGAKHFEGDGKTPEGRYTIDYGNPGSAYHLSLHISYPSAEDAAYAEAQGRSPGGMIMIHGQPNWWPAGRAPGDWTDGCIALSNAEIEQVWESVGDGTPIEIRP